MIIETAKYQLDETIPVVQYLKHKKSKKYFSRETAAAVTVMGKLLEKVDVNRACIPLFYSTAVTEFEDYGLNTIVKNSLDEAGSFSEKNFIETGLSGISPLNQFKVLQNMPLCFVSIEFGFRGDNAVVCGSTTGLLTYVQYSNYDVNIIGAGRLFRNGSVESCFALISKADLKQAEFAAADEDPIIFLNSLKEVSHGP